MSLTVKSIKTVSSGNGAGVNVMVHVQVFDGDKNVTAEVQKRLGRGELEDGNLVISSKLVKRIKAMDLSKKAAPAEEPETPPQETEGETVEETSEETTEESPKSKRGRKKKQ